MIATTLFNRRLLALALGFLIVLGLAAIQTLPRLEDPRIVARHATILTPYPGADAERVEALVTKPIEDELRTLAFVNTIESTSRAGISVVSVEVLDELPDVVPAWSRVRDALADVRPLLPAGAGEPELKDDRGYAHTILVALGWVGPDPVDRIALRRWALALEDRLRGVAGTDHTRLHGAAAERVEVTVDPLDLAALGLSVADLAGVLAAADARDAAGELVGAQARLTVELDGAFDGIARLRALPLTAADGTTLRLGEIAEFRRGLAEPPEELAFIDGRPSIAVGARMRADQRVDLWAARAGAAVEDFARQLPREIALETVFDQAEYTRARLGEVTASLVVGLAIVVAVLLLTMGLRSALVVALALPLTVLLTLGLFRPLGIEIHQMSITGLIVALGLMVDNAIVMTNAVRHQVSEGVAMTDAVRRALRGLAVPLLASTVTTMLAFMPIVLLPGGAGEFVGPLALAVIGALAASYLVALTLVPALASLVLRRGGGPEGRFAQGLPTAALGRGFAMLLRAALRRPAVIATAAIAISVSGFALMPTLSQAFFPPADRDQFHLEIRLPPASSIHDTARVARAMDELIRAEPGVVRTAWFVGANAPQLYYNILGGEDANPVFAHAIVDTAGLELTKPLVARLQTLLDAAFPAARTVVRAYEQGPPFKAPIELRVYGSELETLAVLGRELAAITATTPEVTHAWPMVHRDQPKLGIAVDEPQARLAGVDLGTIAAQLDAALSGRTGGFVLEGTEQLPVLIRFPADWRDDPARLAGLPLAVPGAAAPMPLGAVATLALEPAWSGIERRNGERVQTVRGHLAMGALPETVTERVIGRIEAAGLALPAGYRLELGGEAAERGEAVGRLLSSVAMLLVLMITTVALAFNSFRKTAIVFAAGAQTFGLGLLALKLSGYPFGFVVIVGVMGLIGVAINATIIILSAFGEDERAARGEVEAMVAVLTGPTGRHIWSTTLTTVGGFIPLMLTSGEFWPPFAQTIAGGLLLATIISFFFTPAAWRLVAPRPEPAPAARAVDPAGSAAAPAYRIAA